MGRNCVVVAPRDQRGFALIELLVVVAILAILAGVAIAATGSAIRQSNVMTCRAERRIVVQAIEGAKASNARNEPPPVEGPDGLDAVRTAGLLEWGTTSRYWRYTAPGVGGNPATIERVGLNQVPIGACSR